MSNIEFGYAIRAYGPHQRPDCILSTGTIVRHFPMCNGATYAADYDPATMQEKPGVSEAEWQEYCAWLKEQVR